MPQTSVTQRPTCPHSDNEERGIALAALDANGGNVRRTAAALGISESKLRYWIQVGSGNPEVERIRAKNKKSIRDKFDRLADKLVGVAYRKADDLDAYRATIAACAATDKRLVLDGQPNVIHGQAVHPLLSKLPADVLRALAAGEVPAVVDGLPPTETLELPGKSDGGEPPAQLVQTQPERPR